MKRITFLLLTGWLGLSFVRADEVIPEQAETTFKQLIAAQIADDYEAFIAPGTTQLKAALTKTQFDASSAILAPMLKGGYTETFLGELNQKGYEVYLFRLRFAKGNDILATMSLKDGEVGGILFH